MLEGFLASRAFAFFAKLWPLWLALGLCILGWITLGVHDARVKREAVAAKEVELKVCMESNVKAAQALQATRQQVEKVLKANAEQAAAIAHWEQAEAQARARGDKLAAEHAVRERRLHQRIAELRVQLATPAATPEISCEEADKILTDLAVTQKSEMP
jgi:biopolymer transport protein ExbB/TolQ